MSSFCDCIKNCLLITIDRVIAHYGEATEENEMEFSVDVGRCYSTRCQRSCCGMQELIYEW